MSSDGVVEEADLIRALGVLSSLVERRPWTAGTPPPVDIVSLSLGYYHELPHDQDFDPVLLQQVQALGQRGVAVLAAAGNDATVAGGLPRRVLPAPGRRGRAVRPRLHPGGQRRRAQPGRHDRAVQQRRPLGLRTGRSVRPWSAPSRRPSTAAASRRSPTRRPRAGASSIDPDRFRGGFGTWSGTSFSTPVLAGRLARRLLRARPRGHGDRPVGADVARRHRGDRAGATAGVTPDASTPSAEDLHRRALEASLRGAYPSSARLLRRALEPGRARTRRCGCGCCSPWPGSRPSSRTWSAASRCSTRPSRPPSAHPSVAGYTFGQRGLLHAAPGPVGRGPRPDAPGRRPARLGTGGPGQGAAQPRASPRRTSATSPRPRRPSCARPTRPSEPASRCWPARRSATSASWPPCAATCPLALARFDQAIDIFGDADPVDRAVTIVDSSYALTTAGLFSEAEADLLVATRILGQSRMHLQRGRGLAGPRRDRARRRAGQGLPALRPEGVAAVQPPGLPASARRSSEALLRITTPVRRAGLAEHLAATVGAGRRAAPAGAARPGGPAPAPGRPGAGRRRLRRRGAGPDRADPAAAVRRPADPAADPRGAGPDRRPRRARPRAAREQIRAGLADLRSAPVAAGQRRPADLGGPARRDPGPDGPGRRRPGRPAGRGAALARAVPGHHHRPGAGQAARGPADGRPARAAAPPPAGAAPAGDERRSRRRDARPTLRAACRELERAAAARERQLVGPGGWRRRRSAGVLETRAAPGARDRRARWSRSSTSMPTLHALVVGPGPARLVGLGPLAPILDQVRRTRADLDVLALSSTSARDATGRALVPAQRPRPAGRRALGSRSRRSPARARSCSCPPAPWPRCRGRCCPACAAGRSRWPGRPASGCAAGPCSNRRDQSLSHNGFRDRSPGQPGRRGGAVLRRAVAERDGAAAVRAAAAARGGGRRPTACTSRPTASTTPTTRCSPRSSWPAAWSSATT